MNLINRLFSFYQRIIYASLVSLLFLILLLLTYQILSRQFTWLPQALWSEEIARFLFIWLILLGASQAVSLKGHFTIDFFERWKGSIWIEMSNLVVDLVLLMLALFFIRHGYSYMRFGMNQNSDYVRINLGIFVYSAIFVSGLIWLVSALSFLYQTVLRIKVYVSPLEK